MGICHSKKAEINDSECQHTPISTKSVKCDEIIDRYNFVSANATAVSVTPKTSQTVRSVKQSNPRAIFVSLYKLSQQWDSIPADILMDSIVVINGCRQQMFPQTIDDMRLSVDWPLSKLDFSEHFKQFIQCKDATGMVIWMRHSDCNLTTAQLAVMRSNSIVTPQSNASVSVTNDDLKMDESVAMNEVRAMLHWNLISEQLRCIVDPLINDCYNRLTLSKEWWNSRTITDLNYCDTVNTVCNELSLCEGNFKAIMEVLKQSNPTLLPMIGFDAAKYESERDSIKTRFIESNSNHLFDDNTQICFSVVDAVIPMNSERSISETDDCGFKYSQFGDIADADGYVWFDYDTYANS